MKYYSLNEIEKINADYNIIIGERSNGKTYAILEKIIKEAATKKKAGAIVRRYHEDFRGKRGAAFFSAHVANGLIEKYTKGEWTSVYFYAGRWFFSRTYESETGKEITEKADEPFCYAFSLSEMEHDKSTSYPDITIILFDEFLSRHYLQDEFITFMNTLSTIIRQRTDVKIYMCGNTISHYSPYFQEMGLKHLKSMEQGTIDTYTYGDSSLIVAVEYCSPTERKEKKSNKYFAFDNPRLHMITHGKFELEIYPHLPLKYKPKDIKYTYFIKYETEILQCEIIRVKTILFTYIHKKTTPLQEKKNDLIFGDVIPDTIFHRPNIFSLADKLNQKIVSFYKQGLIYYQDNEVGETVNSYLDTCKKRRF